MEYTESLIDWQNERNFHAKAQRRKGKSKTFGVLFATLRLCVKYSFVLVLLVPPCFAQSRMRVADVVRVVGVTDAQISPNGQWVVYTVSSVEEDKNVSTVWLARVGFDS